MPWKVKESISAFSTQARLSKSGIIIINRSTCRGSWDSSYADAQSDPNTYIHAYHQCFKIFREMIRIIDMRMKHISSLYPPYSIAITIQWNSMSKCYVYEIELKRCVLRQRCIRMRFEEVLANVWNIHSPIMYCFLGRPSYCCAFVCRRDGVERNRRFGIANSPLWYVIYHPCIVYSVI